MSSGTGRRDITEKLLKTALNPNQSIKSICWFSILNPTRQEKPVKPMDAPRMWSKLSKGHNTITYVESQQDDNMQISTSL